MGAEWVEESVFSMSLVVRHWPGEPGLAGEEGVATQGGLSSRNERKRRRRVVGGLGRCERKWVEKNGLMRRVWAMSLLLGLAVEFVLLGAAVGHRPLKDTRGLEVDNSLWLNEVRYTCVWVRERERCSALFCYLCTIAAIPWFPCFVGAEVVHRGRRRACSGALQHAEYHRNIQG